MKLLKIKDWAEADRPREKLLMHGVTSLSDAELVAILISSGTKTESALEVAKKLLLTVDNNLNLLGRKTIAEYKKTRGIGTVKAVTIAAAMEIGRRRRSEEADLQNITASKDVYEIFRPILGDLAHEEFWIILLNRSNKIISKHKLGQGGIANTIVDLKILAKIVIENLASAVILAHNHPSQNIVASSEDKQVTENIKSVMNLLDVKLLDHIIVAGNKYFSFADNNMI